MKARMLGFGEIEVEGKRYDADVVIERGHVRRRRKKPSKPYRDRFGHTPLSAEEPIPWGGSRHGATVQRNRLRTHIGS